MFHIKRETDYSIQLLKEFLKIKSGNLSLRDVSNSTGISFHFLQKIARKLKMARLIKGEKGADGGYCLNLDPDKINLGMIIEAMEGGSAILPCYNSGKEMKCVKTNKKCTLKNKLKKVNLEIVKYLENVKLKDL